MQICIDEFNSRIFEMQMANIEYDDPEQLEDSIERIIDRSLAKGINNLSIKIETQEKNLVNKVLKAGFKLVDTQIMYSISLLDTFNNYGVFPKIETCKSQDIEEIMAIARSAFKLDQFHSNPDLPTEKCDLYYEKWAKNSCNGFADAVLVMKINNQVIGFITLHYCSKEATVGLAAINPYFHGNGYFKSLLSQTIYWLSQRDFEILHYGTQLSNIPVLRTMATVNGKPEFSKHVLNLML